MLINVLPATTSIQAAVVFSVSFEPLRPENIMPPSWDVQLKSLRHDDLELPENIHALDKSAGIVSLLHDVTFDLSSMVVSCQFVDGSSEQWPIQSEKCVAALQKILLDVNESSLEIEREQEFSRRFASDVSSTPPASPPVFPAFGNGSPRHTRHKKQRSLLQTLVACVASIPRRPPSLSLSSAAKSASRAIIPLYNLSSSSGSRLPSPPPTPTIPSSRPSYTALTSYNPSPRARRRRARSELVDACRLYALTELSTRFPKGGFYTWILQSMLRRVTEAVDDMLRANRSGSRAGFFSPASSGLAVAEYPTARHSYPEESEYFSITAASLPPTPSESEEEDGYDEGMETDTDGSSLHTPTSPAFNGTFRWPSSPPPLPPPLVRRHPRTPSPVISATMDGSGNKTRFLVPTQQAEYTARVAQIRRLRRLLAMEESNVVQQAEEHAHQLAVLEIRSRRRAYLNKALVNFGWGAVAGGSGGLLGMRDEAGGGGITPGMAFVLTVPGTSSPLATMGSWGPDEWEWVGPVLWEGDGGDDSGWICEALRECDEGGVGEYPANLAMKRTKSSWGSRMVSGPPHHHHQHHYNNHQPSMMPTLFPVSESEEDGDEDEEQDDEDEKLECRCEEDGGAGELRLSLSLEGLEIHDLLESGGCDAFPQDDGDEDGDVERKALEVERPHHRPRMRMRTSSMYVQPQRIQTPAAEPGPLPVRPRRRSQPLPLPLPALVIPPMPSVHGDVVLIDEEPDEDDVRQEEEEEEDKPPLYTEVDNNPGGDGYDGMGYADDEFTLSMDLPLNMKVQDRGIFVGRNMRTVESLGLECHGWGGV